MAPPRHFVVVLVALLSLGACSGRAERPRPEASAPTTTSSTGVSLLAPSTSPTVPLPSAPSGPVDIRYRVERRTIDAATAGFAAIVEATLQDERGWRRGGFTFTRDDTAPFLIVLAEGPEVDRLCLPYDTYGKYSCQNGPVVALNADRWRTATPKWTSDLATYQQMLVNHEVGHLLGQHHPRTMCPQAGQPAPIMNQQSTELNGCLANPWPLPSEIERAARHDEPLAPPPDR